MYKIVFQSKLKEKIKSQFRIVALDNVGCLFRYHDDWNVDVSARNIWNDGSIDYPEALQAPNFEFRVDDGTGICIQGSHFAAAHRVVVSGGQVENPAVPVFVRTLERKENINEKNVS
jgi:hypothetical protein